MEGKDGTNERRTRRFSVLSMEEIHIRIFCELLKSIVCSSLIIFSYRGRQSV